MYPQASHLHVRQVHSHATLRVPDGHRPAFLGKPARDLRPRARTAVAGKRCAQRIAECGHRTLTYRCDHAAGRAVALPHKTLHHTEFDLVLVRLDGLADRRGFEDQNNRVLLAWHIWYHARERKLDTLAYRPISGGKEVMRVVEELR